MEGLKRSLELVEIKNLPEVYHLTNTLFAKRKEIKVLLEDFNKEKFIKKITPYIKTACMVCNDLVNKENIEKENIEKKDEIKSLYDFFNGFHEVFGKASTESLLKNIGLIEEHIKATVHSLNSVSDFRSNLSLEALFEFNNKDYLQSVKAHQEISERHIDLTDDLFKPLISYFINHLSKDKKAEFLLKLDLFKKSGWAQYIVTKGNEDENPDIVKLYKLFTEAKNNQGNVLDFKKQEEFKNTFEKFFEKIELGINIQEKGLNIASVNNKNVGLYNLATAGMPDGAVVGCPHIGQGETLYVGWATANTKKFAQNLQWFRHLEGIDFSIKMKRKGFENFTNVDGSIVSLAINHDGENIGFLKNELEDTEKQAFQILGETTEVCKGLSVQNGRFKNLVEKISSVALIGSKTELLLTGKTEKEVSDNLLSVVKDVNKALKRSIETNSLTDNNKVKREIYLTDFCNAIHYLSDMNKNNSEFKAFIKQEVTPTFVGLARFYPEMSSHLINTLKVAIINTEGMEFDVVDKITNNANIGFDKDYLQRGFYHFNEKITHLNQHNNDIEHYVKDSFEEIKKPLYEVLRKTEGYRKLDEQKENALWHMLSTENVPNKPLTNHDKNIKEVVSKMKGKKTANKCIEFFKDVQKGFPHITFLTNQEDIQKDRKERLNYLLNVKTIYENHLGVLNPQFNSDKIENLELVEKMTKTVLKDIEVLEDKAKKDIIKEIESFIDEAMRENNIHKDLLKEEIDKFEFSDPVKLIFTDIMNKKKQNKKM